MAALSQTMADRLLGWFKATTFTATSATLYLALFTSGTGPGSEGTEVTGGSYARQGITSSTGWSAISGSPPSTPRQISNAADIVFATATADWGTISHWAIHDASTAGNRIAYGAFDTGRATPSGKIFKALAGQLVLKAQ